jgi:hypothetical protein
MIERLKPGNWRARNVALVALACLAVLATLSWGARLLAAPAQRVGPHLSLASYGHPGVELTIVYPARVAHRSGSPQVSVLTVYARADSAEALTTLELAFPLPDQSLAFVDAQGLPVAGRLSVVPGYPDALPYSLLLAPADTQLQPALLFARSVPITPMLRTDGGAVALSELAFRTHLESRLGQMLHALVAWLSGWGLLLAALLAGLAPLWALTHQAKLRRRLAREQRLSALYTRLRDEIKVENWPEARTKVEELRLLAPAYRDLDQLDTLISTAETATWRREQLYATGLRAYRDRDWPNAVQAFQSIEEETPYYRDVRFLRRTAALYADLRSRDRSLRSRAAAQLGEVADLLDVWPLLQALGDRSNEVADAAEASFGKIGAAAVDTLITGLMAELPSVRERSSRLLQSLGQSVREPLVSALHSPEPRVTAAAARLLRSLGAREELAGALLWAAPEHHAGIVAALVQEGQAACEPLVNALLKAPASREQTLIEALGAIKTQIDITRYLESRLRSAPDDHARQLLQRALKAAAEGFVSADLTKEAVDARPTVEPPAADEPSDAPPPNASPRSLAHRLRLLDRRQK